VGSTRFFSLNGMLSDTVIIEKIANIVAPIVDDERLELVDIEFKPAIADCAYVSRELARHLDVEDFITQPYTLEVSSPGLTRPLKKSEDFVRNKGKMCRIITREAVAGKIEFVGEIGETTVDKVDIKEKIGIFTIPIYAIKKAQLEFEL
jgi:ribosome maturation factor RimP